MADRMSAMDASRRRLLTALMLAPWLSGGRVHAAPPVATRIIALEWLPLELLFALNVTPLAVADTHGYRQWVRKPALPAGVLDVGLRTEPNLEYIAALNPDLLLYSQGYGPRAAQLHAIAPAMAFNFTDGRGQPLQTVRAGLLALAERLGEVAAARAHLADFDRRLVEARARLGSYRRQPLLVFTLLDDRHAVVLGGNSLFGGVMRQLDIDNAWQGESSFWGTAQVGIERLASLPPARAICLDHGDGAVRARLAATPLWRAIPFVRRDSLRTVPAIWLFGATLTALRFCRMLQSLESQW
ncbi:Fe(3+)-hydroxamate ABC transporter substrate-binding protein FhuD [Martelella alba]|uniref:Fe(3+)-hydroxamate ABC transporter substrate-binding protein FhuD n=1 Tax=Martelella alba TaxID=2590451 RepID=A0ABY2SPE2_9HYPH|nr:Fe(3+)-hydroxamate ABC transporter substrate-binding protein FhuD [Martelella alba]TKI07867.1 Fe(3+)-hydroxamate ABC transporter substrate-binding protein FhuD [Martelella alba]